jgi:ABC-2 type transport system ATP-binding protein
MGAVLELSDVTGGYGANRPVIRKIGFAVRAGEMAGLIGLNGAGKSTTIKHILGLLKPQEGAIRIHGRTLEEDAGAYRGAFAYVPESPLLYDELTVQEHLELTAMIYGLDEPTYRRRVDPLLERFDMADKLEMLPSMLSKGMKQKVMIMNAFLAEPSLYMIDEPFLGLDPLGIRSLLELMMEKKKEGAAILISSHILSTLEKYCDRYLVLHRGVLLVDGDLHAVRAAAGLPEASLEDAFYELVKGGGTS